MSVVVCSLRAWRSTRSILDIIVNKPIDQKVVELSSSQRYSLVENSMYHSVFLLKAYNKMTFSYNQVKEHPKLFLAMTGLTHTEFEQLLTHFQGAFDQYVQDNYILRIDALCHEGLASQKVMMFSHLTFRKQNMPQTI